MRFCWGFPSSSTLLLCIPVSPNAATRSGELCLQQRTRQNPRTALHPGSDTEHVAGSGKAAMRWIPPGDCGRALAGYSSGSGISSCLNEFLKWLFPPYLWELIPTSGNLPQAGGRWGKKTRDVETSRESQERERASPSRPLRPGLSAQSLTSASLLSVLAKGRFCCPYSSNSISEIYGTLCRLQPVLYVSAASESGTRLYFRQEKHIRKPLFDMKAFKVS